MAFYVVDNMGNEYGIYESREDAKEAIIDLIQMDLEDDGYMRRSYEIVEDKA